MIKLPKAERQKRNTKNNLKIWIYGVPFIGKTTFANTAPMPLFLNTDGNIKYIDAPAIAIKDEKQAGKLGLMKFGWKTFKEAIGELEKDSQGFKTVVVDLVESVHELCRNYMYDQRGWEHESDDAFRAWDIIRKEFLDTMKRLTNLDMNVILISHEDSSRDLINRAGNSLTAIKPNIQEKLAKQLAGMVDMVGRVVKRGDKRYLVFETAENVFSGGRLDKLDGKKINLTYEDLIKEMN